MPTRKKHITLAAENGQAVESETVLIKRSVFHANEDGTTETKVIVVSLDTGTGAFSITLPEYLAAMCGTGASISDALYSNVVDRYEVLSGAYSRRQLAAATGKRRLWVGLLSQPGDFAKSAFNLKQMVALGMKPVLVYEDPMNGKSMMPIDEETGEIRTTEVTPNIDKVLHPILIPDTPENRAKVQSLIDSIATAAAIIEGARNAADPVAYIHSINDRWSVEPQQGDLLTATGVTATEKAELLQTPADDDEEL